jgi:hypothetical protein
MTFDAPGYEVLELVGFGGSGEVWRARAQTTGELVALTRLRAADDPAARDRLRREAALLSGLAGPHVVALRDVLLVPGGPVLVLEHADGGSLAALLAARSRLEPGEVLTLGLPLARTLADLHGRGVVHGDLSPSNVLLSGDGRPMLADLGVARLLGEPLSPTEGTVGYVDPAVLAGNPPSPASDVYALAVLLTEALTGRPLAATPAADLVDVAPPALVRCLVAGLDSEPERRPTAGQLAEALLELGPATAIRLRAGGAAPAGLPTAGLPAAGSPAALPVTAPVTPAPPRAPIPPPRPGTPLPRVLAGAALAVVLLAAAIGSGLLWARGSGAEAAVAVSAEPGATTAREATPAHATSPAALPVHWQAVMSELDAVRDDAFVAGDPDALADAYVPGSAALATESARLQQLLDERLVVRGLELELVRVDPLSATGDHAVLEVTDRLPGYDLLDAAGRLLEHRPARGARTWRVELRRIDRAWRIADVQDTGR